MEKLGEMNKMNMVFIPCKVQYNIREPLMKTFDGKYMLVDLSSKGIDNYSRVNEINELKNEIRNNIKKVLDTVDKNKCNFFVMATGSALHTGLIVSELKDLNVEFNMLVYEKQVDKYIII